MSIANYGFWDRTLHRVAFRVGMVQTVFSDLEDTLFRGLLESLEIRHPVFICGLPRAGTTTLLNVLVETGQFASHTYRDMPFILSPLLWARLSGPFLRPTEERERAHGDGVLVSNTSPEAFEEPLWRRFWASHYLEDRILPWRPDERSPEFDRRLERLMKKVVAVRQGERAGSLRYVSKNNLNMARVAALPSAMRAGTVLVPFRDPIQQAASMRRQHMRFLGIHDSHPFTREYMEAIGHYEFGRGLRPVDYGDWLADAPGPDTLEFWVRYWTAAYGHVLDHLGPSVVLVPYDRLVKDPAPLLAKLAPAIDLTAPTLTRLADRFQPPRVHGADPGAVDGQVVSTAMNILDRLRGQAIGS